MKALLLHSFLFFLLAPVVVHAGAFARAEKSINPNQLTGNVNAYTKVRQLEIEPLLSFPAYCHFAVGRPIQKNLQAQQVSPALCCPLLYLYSNKLGYRQIQLDNYQIHHYPSHHFW